ncbi:hypothetical protein Syun_014676 [Stephania yunnanensis]|uniref:Uncharacterized protein n=1 Tax=Stephania yunnanensis TaxID=152371 RepID=A0AAP0JKV4_9MAGN
MVGLVKTPLGSRHPRVAASTNNLSNSLLSFAVHKGYNLRVEFSKILPRDPPRFQFEHKGVEFKDKNEDCTIDETLEEGLGMYKSHFSFEMLSQIQTNVRRTVVKASVVALVMVIDTRRLARRFPWMVGEE